MSLFFNSWDIAQAFLILSFSIALANSCVVSHYAWLIKICLVNLNFVFAWLIAFAIAWLYA